jgi:hypothetical protein
MGDEGRSLFFRIATASVPQALGTVIGGLVLILLAQLFGIITSLSATEIGFLVSALLLLISLVSAGIAYGLVRDIRSRQDELLRDVGELRRIAEELSAEHRK